MFKCLVMSFSALCLISCTTALQQQAAHANADLGIAFLQAGDVVAAKEKVLLAQQQSPYDPAVLDALAFFYERTGEVAKAAEEYQRAVHIAPIGSTQNNYGAFLCRSGQYEAGIKRFYLAIADPNYLYPAEAYENAGLCALKIPNRVLAKENFQQAVLHDPTRRIALFELAKLSYNQRRYEEARAYLSHYQRVTPRLSNQAQHFIAQLATMPE